MFCPEGYFTPKSLERAFQQSLNHPRVLSAVYFTQGIENPSESGKCPTYIYEACAELFACKFVIRNLHHFCLCSHTPNGVQVNRVDEWALETKSSVPNDLPLDELTARKIQADIRKVFLFVDQDLWVFDDSMMQKLESDKSFSLFEKLIAKFDGWSVCFPNSIYPKDLGSEMRDIAQTLLLERQNDRKVRRGRPRIVDDIVEAIERTYPDGTKNVPAKEVERGIENIVPFKIKTTSLANAIKQAEANRRLKNQ